MRSGKKSEGFRRQARLKLSFQIAAIAVIIFFFASMAGFILFRSSLNNLTQNSKDRFLESISTLVSSSQSYNSLVLTDIQVNKGVLPMTSPEFFKEVETAIQGETVTPTQETGNDVLKSSAENGILGISLSFYALPPQTAGNTNPLIIITSDEDYMYRELPPEIAALMDKGGGRYKLFEGGIPGMGLDEEYLVSAYEVPCDNPDQSLWYFTFKPMGELIAGIDGFLSDETGSVYLVMILVMSLSTLGLLAISILIMGYLLNRRIAKPIGELSRAAEQVMEGDLDIRVEIRPREEFIELKTAFNKITSSLSRIITLAMEEGPESARSVIREEAGREKEAPAKYMKPRSTILIQITAMFIVIFIISGLVGLLAVNRTMNNMINETKDRLVETEAELQASSHQFGFELIESISEISPDDPAAYTQALNDFGRAIGNRTISTFQELSNAILKSIIDYGLYGMELIYDVAPKTPPLMPDYLVVITSDIKYMYTKPPEGVVKLLEKGEDSWKLFEEGFPELGINEPCLVTTFKFTGEMPEGSSQPDTFLWSVEYKSVGEKIAAIDNFYDEESRKLFLTMGVTTVVSILVIILVTIFALSYLIKKKLTEPIDELVLAAQQVIDGNFDVEINIRPGEELEGLKRAFSEMVKSMGDLVDKSTQG